jgi:uncharacterized protein (TIGR01777 family)
LSRRIALTGGSGLIGQRLRAALVLNGDRVVPFVRDRARAPAGARFWNPSAGELAAADLEGIDAVVHLAGEPIASGRWTAARKRRILESRTHSTQLLSEVLSRLEHPPSVLVSASAIGVYGDRGETWLDEMSEPGTGFLPDVCVAWERAVEPARAAGVRVALARIGIALSPEGGALAQTLPLFRVGLGGRLGNGRQYMSWIGIDDLVAALQHAIECAALAGPFNAVAPNPVTNAEFTRVLARVLARPALLAVPSFALRLALGEMGQALLLDGARIAPHRLESTGFQFQHPDLEQALRLLLR